MGPSRAVVAAVHSRISCEEAAEHYGLNVDKPQPSPREFQCGFRRLALGSCAERRER